MSAHPHGLTSAAGIGPVQEEFTRALPRIVRHAGFAFRHVRCLQSRQECVAEAVALVWKWWVRLRQRGRHPEHFVSALAAYAARAVKSGRRLCGQERAKDVLSAAARRRHGFTVEALLSPRCDFESRLADPGGQRRRDRLEERLRDNTFTPVPEQAAFRLDFPRWLDGQGERRRRLIERMMQGESTGSLADEFGVSAARVSQLRREFHQDWQAFHGEPA